MGGDLGGQALLVEMMHGPIVPVAAGHESLEASDPDLHGKHDGLELFPRDCCKELPDRRCPGPGAPLVPEDARKGLVEAAEFLCDLLDIRRRQAILRPRPCQWEEGSLDD